MAPVERVPYSTFGSLDIRVARVIAAEPIPGKTRIMRGTIDIGNEERNVIIGGAQHCTPEEMMGRRVIAIVNLEPKKVAGIESEAMLLAADVDGVPFWLEAGESAPPGSPIR